MSDVDDYGEWKTGKRITGINFSGNLFFLKVGLAVAGAMVGFLLALVRLRRQRESAKRLRAERYRAAILSHSRRRLSDHRRRGAPAEG